jgi:hypothetical protein
MARKIKKMLIVGAVITAVLLSSVVVFAHGFDIRENLKLEEVSGEVKIHIHHGYYLVTPQGTEYRLMLGPPWYVEDLGLELKRGDRISVEGYTDDFGNMMVMTLKKGKDSYTIHDPEDLEKLGARRDYRMHGRGMHGPRGLYGDCGRHMYGYEEDGPRGKY